MKIAVYVEGQTELIFVREFLLKWYGYDSSAVGLECIELRSTEAIPTDYSFGSTASERFYTIVNTGGDVMALSKALENAPKHRNLGYKRILVLRDMYCDTYKSAQQGQVIDPELNRRFIEGAQKAIDYRDFQGFVYCHFAIMEIEAWLLGMGWYLEKVDPLLNQDQLLRDLDLNLNLDPEVNEYHPAQRLSNIYAHVGKAYDKHKHDVNSIMSHLDRSDFEMLLELEKCASFNTFVRNLTH